uniref:NADH-ubiquinone oxidoreductase chain 6 n=1 Tax=Eptatretus atami TaxID=50612 RepID=A0A2Z5RG74_9VERT|nr:NADH dehydrogenase subunit 6 [Eptatretus atami]
MKINMVLEVLFLTGMVILVVDVSPYFGALGLIVTSLVGCFMIMMGGNPFLSLSLLLIYLGGMMVVFSYCTALVLDMYPSIIVKELLMKLVLGVLIVLSLEMVIFTEDEIYGFKTSGEEMMDFGFVGAGALYGNSWLLVIFGAIGLFLMLLVVLEITRSMERGAYRVI